MAVAGLDAEIDDTVDLFVGNRLGQAEPRDLGPHHAAALGVAVDHDAVVTQWHQVARHGQRGWSGADQGDALTVLLLRNCRQVGADVALGVSRDPLQPADRHRFLLDQAAAAGRLARTIAGAPQNAGKDVGFPIDRPGLGVFLVRDQADVFGHRRMCRAGPLAIDNLMEVVGIPDLGRLQNASPAGRLSSDPYSPWPSESRAAAPYTRTRPHRHPRP